MRSGPVVGVVARTFSNDFDLATEDVNGAAEVAFGYDADSLLTQAGALTIARDAATGLVTGTTLEATTDTFQYNPFGEPTRQTAQVNGTNVFDVQIARNDFGRITQRIETVDGITRVFDYGYDLAGRLWQVGRNGTLVARYLYDLNGNRVEVQGERGPVSATYDAQDRLLTYNGTSYIYTANGELATKTVGGQTTSYVYDTLGNLTQVTKPNGDVITYTVDGRGRRVGKALNGVLVKGWLYADQLRPIAELDGNNQLVSRFIYGSRANVPEYVIKGGETYRIFSDHLGTPRVVVHATTGVIVQRLDVQPFGEIIQDTNPGWQPFGFAGGLYDSDTGLLRFGARDYDPQTGRWTAKDPIGFLGGATGLFSYAANDPVNLSDPSGMVAPAVIGAGIGAVVGGFSAAVGAHVQNGSKSDVVAAAILGALGGAVTGATTGSSAFLGIAAGLTDTLSQLVTGVGKCGFRFNVGSVVGSVGSAVISARLGGLLSTLPGFGTQSPIVQELVKGAASLPTAGFGLLGAALDPVANPVR